MPNDLKNTPYSLGHKSKPKNKSYITIEPGPSVKSQQPFILDEGGVPRYQLPVEKTRQQVKSQIEQT